MSGSSLPRVVVAGWELTLLDLGAMHAPLSWVFPDAEPEARAWLPFGALLCRRGNDVVLVDCGVGPFADVYNEDIRAVEIVDALAAAGCEPDDVSAVVLTHLDFDHAGGIVRATRDGALVPALPGAGVSMLRAAYETLVGRGAERSKAVEAIDSTLSGAGEAVEGVSESQEIVAGAPISLRAAPGHRVGHACVELSVEGERFVFLADAVHAREHAEHPDWDSAVDSEPEVALATRRALIDELAGSGAVVACSHVAAFGRIERAGDGTPVWVDVQ